MSLAIVRFRNLNLCLGQICSGIVDFKSDDSVLLVAQVVLYFFEFGHWVVFEQFF